MGRTQIYCNILKTECIRKIPENVRVILSILPLNVIHHLAILWIFFSQAPACKPGKSPSGNEIYNDILSWTLAK